MKISAVLKKSDLKLEAINIYEEELTKIKEGQARMSAEMDEMERILDSAD